MILEIGSELVLRHDAFEVMLARHAVKPFAVVFQMLAKSVSLDVLSVPVGSQTGSQPADKSDTKVDVSPQGALPILSVPGATQTDSKLAEKNGEDTNTEVSSQGSLPVLSIPGCF
jgi:hypothetical protein